MHRQGLREKACLPSLHDRPGNGRVWSRKAVSSIPECARALDDGYRSALPTSLDRTGFSFQFHVADRLPQMGFVQDTVGLAGMA